MERSPEIEAIVRRLWSARTRGDREIIDGLWSRSEHLLIIGSDESEWIEGAEESLVVAGTQINEWLIEDSKLKRVVAYEAGSVGWAASEEERTSPNGRTSIFRRTMVFVLEAGSWKIIQSHFSAPVPNIEAAGVDMTRTLSELLDSVGDDDDLLPFAGRISGTVTLLFTDIVDSTQLDQEIGDLAWSQTVKHHFDTLRTLVEKHRGTVVKTLGDGGMFAFDSGSTALRAAIEIQRSTVPHSYPPIRVRIGVHTGDV
ncbi:MAG TPA: nuclear transport factor 2 family protein, partial [Acidimicrobiia bacterium]